MARGRRREAGIISAEMALAIPALVVVLALCLSGLGLAVDQVRAADAARAGARAASRGDSPDRVRELAARAAPSGAEVVLHHQGKEVTVRVEAPPRRLLVTLPAASAEAVAVLEPGVGGP